MNIEEKMMISLIEEFPEFKQSQYYENEDSTPYNVFGDFSIYMQDGISANSLAGNEIKRAIIFMNNMANSHDKYVLNLLVVGILEIFTDSPVTIKWARENLNERGVELFEKTLKGWS